MGKIIMGYWDCRYCGAKGVPGDQRECTACGHPRDESVTFYMKDKNYVSEEKASKISRKPDWYCSYCNTLNNSEKTECEGCGASRSESEKNYFQIQAEKAAKAAKAVSSSRHNEDYDDYNEYEDEKPKRSFKGLIKNRIRFFGILALIILALTVIFIPKKKAVEVSGLNWERDVKIEKYANVDESDWELPDGANLHSKELEIHHYNHVIDHYEEVEVRKSRDVLDGYDTHTRYNDLGNGYFEEETYETPRYTTEYYYETESQPVYRDDPVYATKYYYDIWKWIPYRDVYSSGADHNPYWGELNLREDEREASREGTYEVTFTNKKGKTFTYEIPEDEWNRYNIGDKLKIKTSPGSRSFKVIE